MSWCCFYIMQWMTNNQTNKQHKNKWNQLQIEPLYISLTFNNLYYLYKQKKKSTLKLKALKLCKIIFIQSKKKKKDPMCYLNPYGFCCSNDNPGNVTSQQWTSPHSTMTWNRTKISVSDLILNWPGSFSTLVPLPVRTA